MLASSEAAEAAEINGELGTGLRGHVLPPAAGVATSAAELGGFNAVVQAGRPPPPQFGLGEALSPPHPELGESFQHHEAPAPGTGRTGQEKTRIPATAHLTSTSSWTCEWPLLPLPVPLGDVVSDVNVGTTWLKWMPASLGGGGQVALIRPKQQASVASLS